MRFIPILIVVLFSMSIAQSSSIDSLATKGNLVLRCQAYVDSLSSPHNQREQAQYYHAMRDLAKAKKEYYVAVARIFPDRKEVVAELAWQWRKNEVAMATAYYRALPYIDNTITHLKQRLDDATQGD